jgi:DHA2 family multidrug resistance protein
MPGAGGQERSAAGDRSPWLIAGVVSIATFMEVLDASIANVALRHIAGSLAAGEDESTWVLTSYLVANAVILPVSGWLSSVIGRKRFYMSCVALFTVSSLLCALAPNLQCLVIFRILQGLGGGGLAPSEQSILADTFPEEKRGQAFALYGVAVIVAPTFGPTLGGWITDNFSWHWIFLINLPMGLLSLALVHLLVVEPDVLVREREQRLSQGLKVDYVGFALVALFLGALEIVLDKGQREDWFSSAYIITFAVLSVVALVALIPWELRREHPIVDLRLLGRRQFGASFVVMLTIGAILFSSTQILPQMLQTNYGYTATWAGLALMPGGLVMLCVMPLVGALTRVVPSKYMIMFGMACIALSMWHLTGLAPASDYWYFAVGRIYQTIGLPFLFVPITAASYAGLPPDKTSEASAIINVARNLGGSIGVATAQTIFAQRTQVHHAYLSAHVGSALVPYQTSLSAATGYFSAQGTPDAAARNQAFGWIAQQVANQSDLLAYIDVFMTLAIVAAVVVPVGLLLRSDAKGAEAL